MHSIQPEIGCLTGISWWKRARIRRFFKAGSALPHRRSAAAAVETARRRGGAVAAWASRQPPGLAEAASRAGIPVWLIEDGFIRSVGLGSALALPCSIIVDRSGIHYDPSRSSDLETLLASADFSPDLVARAERLRQRIVAAGVTKYNLRGHPIALPAGRRCVLVPGQVADDRSVMLGGAGITDMGALLARVRAVEPDAFILFKPHPDVDAGLRAGAIPDAEALRHADRVVRAADLTRLLDHIDAVHALTSLTGFEALMRGREVFVHGHPFYAGWGLTRDLATPPQRRCRRLTTAELIAAALILYPLYFDPLTGRRCGPEELVDALARHRPGLALDARLRRLGGGLAARWR